MRRAVRGAGLAAALWGGSCAAPAFGWGYVGHRIVAESAAAALPAPLGAFYSGAARRLSAASIEPDSVLRDRDGEQESANHFLNLDLLGAPPFDGIPAGEKEALLSFGRDRLQRAGRLPWRVAELHDRLREAFAARDWKEAVRLSGWLSHYVADAHQPLHSTSNHDGQKTGNAGIHAAFESDMIDRGRAVYRGRAALPAGFGPRRIEDPARFVLQVLAGSHGQVEAVLKADSKAVLLVKKQGKEYLASLEALAGEMAGRQLQQAAAASASLWHSAWVQAGRPQPPPPRPRKGKVRAGRP
ncbi:MAG TPA: S1/P1 nuclease [Candidatus Polarisedimenticolia bacterium]|nr:S1/P1 nuclease [Candidatus Polarisedimenticolia bacterium]